MALIPVLSKTVSEFNGNQSDWKHFTRTNFSFFSKDTTIREKHQGVSMAVSCPPPAESRPAARMQGVLAESLITPRLARA